MATELNNGKIVTIGGRNTRQSTCKCCGSKKGSDTMVKLLFPNNRFMVCDECIATNKPAIAFNVTSLNEKSENCTSHRVVVSIDNDNADRFWLESYGFKKMGGYHTITYNNAQSGGVIVANLIRNGYSVKVGLLKSKLVPVGSVDDYDNFTKAVCMRNFE